MRITTAVLLLYYAIRTVILLLIMAATDDDIITIAYNIQLRNNQDKICVRLKNVLGRHIV